MSFPPSVEPTNMLTATGALDPSAPMTELHFADGRVLRLPTALLQGGAEEGLLESASGPSVGGITDVGERRDALHANSGDVLTIPLIEERLEVGKRTVATGIVRLQKTVQEFQAAVDEPLAVRTYDIERVRLDRPVEEVPEVRLEGNTTVYPLVEERLVLTKQLILKEEVRVTRRDTERRETQVVTLRREHLVVEREPVGRPEREAEREPVRS